MHGSRNSYLDSRPRVTYIWGGHNIFVDVVHNKYINFPAVSKLPNYSVDTAESREAWERWKLQGQDWQEGQEGR